MEGVDLWLIGGAALVMFLGIFVYVLFMVFLPEWVGITGKVAQEAERNHQEGSQASEGELLDKMQRTKSGPPGSKHS